MCGKLPAQTALFTVLSSSTQISSMCILLAGLRCGDVLARDVERRLLLPEDVHRINSVGDKAISPDGKWIAYRVGTKIIDRDESSSAVP